jgi:DNA-binding transcriptional MerR regulator
MGEVADILDVSHSLLRFWEKKFDIIKPAKNKKGNRLFTPEDVRNLKIIYHLVKERRMTLDGAQKHLKANRGDVGRDMQLAERLASIRSLLVEVRNSLGGEETVVDDNLNYELRVTSYESEDGNIEEVREEEVTARPVEELIEELLDAPEEMPDFDSASEFEPAEDELPEEGNKPEEPPKPVFIEQTLF